MTQQNSDQKPAEKETQLFGGFFNKFTTFNKELFDPMYSDPSFLHDIPAIDNAIDQLKNKKTELRDLFGGKKSKYSKPTMIEEENVLESLEKQQIMLFKGMVDDLPETAKAIFIFIFMMQYFKNLSGSIEDKESVRNEKARRGEQKDDDDKNWSPSFEIETPRLQKKMMRKWTIAVTSFDLYAPLEELCKLVNKYYPFFPNAGVLSKLDTNRKPGDNEWIDIAEAHAKLLSEEELEVLIGDPANFSTTDLVAHFKSIEKAESIIKRWILFKETKNGLRLKFKQTLSDSKEEFLKCIIEITRTQQPNAAMVTDMYSKITAMYEEFYGNDPRELTEQTEAKVHPMHTLHEKIS